MPARSPRAASSCARPGRRNESPAPRPHGGSRRPDATDSPLAARWRGRPARRCSHFPTALREPMRPSRAAPAHWHRPVHEPRRRPVLDQLGDGVDASSRSTGARRQRPPGNESERLLARRQHERVSASPHALHLGNGGHAAVNSDPAGSDFRSIGHPTPHPAPPARRASPRAQALSSRIPLCAGNHHPLKRIRGM